ncbi:MAG: hypothetical protein HC799_18200, partial [Limnothrix sp. RL_2_0]|nr:hypothetical protein [Limnothrix sp. RL_2_0]
MGRGCWFLALLTFTWLPDSYSYMVGWPYILIWQGAFLILGIYTTWLCRQFSVPFSRLGYGLDGVVLLTLIVVTLSTLNAPFRAVAAWNLLLVINYVVCLYFLVNWMRSGKLTRHFLWMVLSATGVVTSIISLALWRPNPDMWLSQNFDAAIRNAQPLGHHNFVGGYALLMLPIVVTFAISQSSWRKWMMGVAPSIVAIALYASGSRGALIGAIAIGIVAIGLGFILSKAHNRRHWAIAGGCFILIMALALASYPRIRALFSISPAVKDNTPVSIVSISDGPTKDRFFMVESTQNILKDRPLLGVGPGNLSRVYNTYRPIEAGAGLTLVQQMHNTPAQLAAELGILGLITYLALLSALAKLGLSLYRRITEQRDRILLFGVGASWLGYGISSLSDYQLENIGISMTLLTTTALLISLADAYSSDSSHSSHQLQLSKYARRIISLCLLVILCSNFQMWSRVNTGLYIGDSAMQSTWELDFISADAKLNKASRLVSWDPTYPALAAENMMNLLADINTDDLDKKEDTQELEQAAIS